MSSILIIEDEKDISDLLSLQLRNHGHHTQVISDGQKALEYIQNNDNEVPTENNQNHFDMIILDRMLPGLSGLEICKFLRVYKKTKSLPILMVTALARPEQIVEGLEGGADDYITKPFEMNIFLARTKALLRRREFSGEKQPSLLPKDENILKHGPLTVDLEQCKVWIEQEEIELTLSEYKLLGIFLSGPGKVFTRNQLVSKIQDGPVHVTDRTIDTHIFGLRKKLKDQSNLIETIRGIGYRVSIL